MKKFQFKLQALLTLRQRAEQGALEKYSHAVLARQAAMDRLTEAERALSHARAVTQEQTRKGCTALAARQLEEHCHRLDGQRKKEDAALGQSEIELNQAFQRMLIARQEREAVETYLTHQREHHDRELVREERKIIEDIVNRRPVSPMLGKTNRSGAWN